MIYLTQQNKLARSAKNTIINGYIAILKMIKNVRIKGVS